MPSSRIEEYPRSSATKASSIYVDISAGNSGQTAERQQKHKTGPHTENPNEGPLPKSSKGITHAFRWRSGRRAMDHPLKSPHIAVPMDDTWQYFHGVISVHEVEYVVKFSLDSEFRYKVSSFFCCIALQSYSRVTDLSAMLCFFLFFKDSNRLYDNV